MHSNIIPPLKYIYCKFQKYYYCQETFKEKFYAKFLSEKGNDKLGFLPILY